jgi:hypothetical protein
VANALILKPYERRHDPGLFARIVLGAALIGVAAFYGLMCSILPMQLLSIPAVPILLMFALILWMLPDLGTIQTGWLEKSVVWFVGLSVLWPSYVAVNIPGLPWITPPRAAALTLTVVFILNFATSAELRKGIADAMNSVPWARKLFWCFWAVTTFSIVLGPQVFFSLSKYVNNQIFWTMMLAVSTWLALREGFAMRISRVVAWTIIIVSVLAIYETHIQSIFWLGRLPSFLKADLSLFEQLGEAETRAGLQQYRARGTFSVALYFAEYLSISFPFVLHFLVNSKRVSHFILLSAGAVAVMIAMYETGSRSAMLGLLLSFITYGFMLSWRVRLQRPGSIPAAASLYAYPIFAMLTGVLVVFWRRAHVLIIGGGAQQASTDTRETQWAMGLPKIAAHPFGSGPGQSGNVLGYFNPGSENPTVDSYFLTLLLDYGVLGLITFVSLFGVIIWKGFRGYNRAKTEEFLLLAPITVALFNFLVIKAVSSTEFNMPIALILVGCALGLIGRQNRMDAEAEARQYVAPPARQGRTALPAQA